MDHQELFRFFGKQYKKVFLKDGWAIYPSFASSLPAPDWFKNMEAPEETMMASLRDLVSIRFEKGWVKPLGSKMPSRKGKVRVVDKKGNVADLRHLGENVFIRDDYYQLANEMGKGLIVNIYHSVLEGIGMVIMVGGEHEPLFVIGEIIGDFTKMDVYIKTKEGEYESVKRRGRRSALPRAGRKGKSSAS